MIRKYFSLFILTIISLHSWATHNRAGEITYTHVSGFTYFVTITTYTKLSSITADRDSLEINWGDNTGDTLVRTFSQNLMAQDIKINKYTGTHTYPGFGTYILNMTDPNRVASILNINGGNSVNEAFYLEDTLKILDPAFYGYNSSPVLLNPPIDYACPCKTFVHNPNAYDADGDSLAFSFTIPKKAPGVFVTNYVDPNMIGGSCGTLFNINNATGEVTWSKPDMQGIYNIAILIREYRNGFEIGTMIRDMQIIVNDCLGNLPPQLASIHDTCVVAGTLLTLHVSATDPNTNQIVNIDANGGPFIVNQQQSTFSSSPGLGNATGTFNWQTDCDHVRTPFYQVIFHAYDNDPNIALSDLQNWLIRVVAPAPQNLTALPVGNSVVLNWQNPYTCSTATRFIGFSVWRRIGSNPFVPDTCQPGLAGQGYSMIANHLQTYNFIDDQVVRGIDYCYRVLAEFADSTGAGFYYNTDESLASNEACTELHKDVPVITNVDVLTTDQITGSIFIQWSKPNAVDLDTIQNTGPYTYHIFRGIGFSGNNFSLIQTITAPSFSALTDTFFTDNNLNTADNPYHYRISFFSGVDSIGETEVASSVYLNVSPSDNQLQLSWNEIVPWSNSSYEIYKEISPGNFSLINTVLAPTYTDINLANDSTYCYKIKSIGGYSAPGIINPIINHSEIKCATPIDTVGPCAPTLQVFNNCNTDNFTLGEFVNDLVWNNPNLSCANDVIKYYIYYSPDNNHQMILIDTNLISNQIEFIHTLNNSIAGCYAVAAVDSYYNVGPLSQTICVDNCPEYNLPNVFTPNGDEHNDLFHPILPYKFIDHVEFKVYTTWGDLVFETNDPYIGWNGKKMNVGFDLPDGTYYYVCNVFENRVEGIVQTSNPLSGFIHLIR